MKNCTLLEVDPLATASPELVAAARFANFKCYTHEGGGSRPLIITVSVNDYTLEEAWDRLMGVRRWRNAAVSIQGHLDLRMADQKRIGRQRRPGERSPVPLPDWYDLTHVAYVHAADFGFDINRAVWQYLPAPGEIGLNIAEALHLRQPA